MRMNRRFELLGTAALAVILAAMNVSAQGLTGTLRGTDGSNVNVAQMRGKVTVLLFGGMLDPQSPEELPVLQQLSERYKARNVEVIWVSLDEASVADTVLAQYATKNGFAGRVLRDPSGQVLGSVSTGKRPQLPTVVVLDANGAVSGKPIGGFDREAAFADRLTKIIEPLL